jgi:ethanolamine utilization protein EutN
MHLARVIGTVVCAHKNTRLAGVTLLLVQPVGRTGADAGRALVATDAVGAGIGERVFFVRGSEATYPFAPTVVPTDATVIGIVDACDDVGDDRAAGAS